MQPSDPFHDAATRVFDTVVAALAHHSGVRVDRAGNVLAIRFDDGHRCSLDRHYPIEQIWMADGHATWQFEHTGDDGQGWRDTRGHGELLAVLAANLSPRMARPIDFA